MLDAGIYQLTQEPIHTASLGSSPASWAVIFVCRSSQIKFN